jgi:hypothetical protein
MQKQLLFSFLGVIALLLWEKLYEYSCISLFFPLFAGIVIFKSTYEFVVAKRICLAKCYFEKNSLFYLFFTKKVFLFVFSLFSGIILSLSLFAALVNFNTTDFILFGGDVFVLVFLYNFLLKKRSLNKNVKYPITKNITSWINATIITFILLIIALYQTPPDYIQNDLFETIQLHSKESFSQCKYINPFIVLIKEAEAFKWWIMLKLSVLDINHYLKIFIWLFFLIGNYLFVFAFGRYILEIGDFERVEI